MIWESWIKQYMETYCVAQELQSTSIKAYGSTLKMFRTYARNSLEDKNPEEIVVCDVLKYINYLRRERNNGHAAVNRQVTIIREFYRAMVAMDRLEPRLNPMAHFPRIKGVPRKIADTLSDEEMSRLIATPGTDTILGVRDRALLVLLLFSFPKQCPFEGVKEVG